MEKIVINKDLSEENQFHLEGVDWNDNTKNQTQEMIKFLDENFVKKIHVLPNQHRNAGEKWDEFAIPNMISPF